MKQKKTGQTPKTPSNRPNLDRTTINRETESVSFSKKGCRTHTEFVRRIWQLNFTPLATPTLRCWEYASRIPICWWLAAEHSAPTSERTALARRCQLHAWQERQGSRKPDLQWTHYKFNQPINQIRIFNMARIADVQGRTGFPNRPWLSRQTGPISSGITRNSGPLHKYPNRALTVLGSLPCSTPSFPLHLFVTLFLGPYSSLHHYRAAVNVVIRLSYFNIWRGSPPAWRTNRPTW